MKLLFFSPHSAIWVHAFPEALIAEALRDGGHEIVYVTCGGQLNAGCIAMSARGLSSDSAPNERAKVCADCKIYANLLRRKFRFLGRDLSDEIAAEDIAEIERIVANVSKDNLLELEVLGVDVGRAALYEFLLTHKKFALEFADDDEWQRYRVALKNALYALFGARRLIAREAPDAVVMYNSLYSVNRAVCRLAANRNIPHYSLHSGGNLAHRLQTMMVSKGDVFDLLRAAVAAWPSLSEFPVSPDDASLVTDHFLELLSGRSVFAYSAPQSGGTSDPRTRFGIAPGQTVLCATLSSYDERFAAEVIGVRAVVTGLLFPTQTDWVRALIEYAAARPELFLVIRVHPREFPNKREGVKSHHAREMEKELRNLPPNVAVNWPTDKLSLYDLAEITDVFLNAWSSVGKEMSLLGIPVVSYSADLPLYPVDPRYMGTTGESYFAAVERALADGWRYENVRRAYRWYAVEFARTTVDLSDGFKTRENRAAAGWLRDKTEKLLRLLDPHWQQRYDCWRRPHPIAAQPEIARVFESGATSPLDIAPLPAARGDDEAVALRAGIGRIARAMYPDDRARHSRLGRWLMRIEESSDAA